MQPNGLASKIPATIIAIASYVIVAGIFTQSGVILGPAAAYFHAGAADTALLFSYLNSGNLGGIIASMAAFPALTIRQAFFGAYALFFGGIAILAATHDLHVACAAEVLVGFGVGMGLSTGAVIIAKTFVGPRRAIIFLGTDCAFSGAGYVIPSLAGLALAAGWRWQTGYLMVAVLTLLVLGAATRISFPSVAHGALPADAGPAAATDAPWRYSRVLLFAVALALYLTGQNTFTIWSPTYLHARFALPQLQAGAIVGTFFGASSFGLISAAIVVTRVAPRIVLTASIALAVLATYLIVLAPSAGSFFALTAAFGFVSTCMFKLMISIGSEQISSAPPRLVTFLLSSASVGGIAAPALSAPAVKALGTHASLELCCACYTAAFVVLMLALFVEYRARSIRLRAERATATENPVR